MLALGEDRGECLLKTAVRGGIHFARLGTETRVILCWMMGCLFNKGIHCHQLILIIN